MEPEPQAAVEIKPQRLGFRFTRRSAIPTPADAVYNAESYIRILSGRAKNAIPYGECGLELSAEPEAIGEHK